MTLQESLLGYAALAALITIIPGTDTALVLRYSIAQGRRHAYMAAFGMIAGAFVWGAAAATGVSALLTVSTVAYDVLRLGGAAYMLWLGIGLWRASLKKSDADLPPGALPHLSYSPHLNIEPLRRTWLKGFVSNLLNPKYGMFCIAVIPQFLVPEVPAVWMGLLLSVVSNVEAVVWFVAIISAAQFFRKWLQGASFRRWIDRVTGTVLGTFGVVAVVETFAPRHA
ncbi:LysE family translocator [Arthrobacter cupressi]|uniref:Threonine/homoserine/homoserine lactone efflux protein n=1 Tax=Arthrobacter cupressi TaxID=1045773 RepID=A0A1G8V7C6_9MICC|nr:LysE family translocator [Arthrobacter cupressi]NYD78672.1 threonine/homoserine/homoserine lactone efflux protein [Arthrobacter cupressi]SDJ61784.1 Threonine/homoserine/homoserine lactone efflux protein [Arthrobacter cupressi]